MIKLLYNLYLFFVTPNKRKGPMQAQTDHMWRSATVRPTTHQHTLVNQHGQSITPQGFKGEVVTPSLDYCFEPDDTGLGLVLELAQAFFPTGTRFVNVATFHASVCALRAEIAANPQVCNLGHGLCLPVPLPELPASDDLGVLVDNVFGPAMVHAYNSTMYRSSRLFQHDRFAGQVGIVKGSRYEELIYRLQHGPTVGLMFFPLLGFSPVADVEMIRHFPPGFCLSGVVDMATAIVAHTDTLLGSEKAPRLDCAANTLLVPRLDGDENTPQVERDTFSLSIHPRPQGHTIGLRCLNACDIYTGGVLYTGRL